MSEFESIPSIARSVTRRERSAVEVVRDALDRSTAVDAELNAFRETLPDAALVAAAEVDRRIAAGESPPLAGVPLAVKDNIATRAGRTSCGSRILEEYRSPFSATAVERLEAAGAIVIGKTNCDEFGMGSSTEHCAFGPVRNPWDPESVPGGSSGGSAAAVASGACPAALGSDTGGSIRQPASFCGVVGVKPSYGRVSRYGLVAFGSSLEQIGPIARSVTDAALLLQAMAGPDERDATCTSRRVPDYISRIDEPLPELRIGVPAEFTGGGNDPAVDETVERSVETFRRLGAEIVELDLPLTDYAIATYYIIAPAEASSNLARYDGVRYGRRASLEPGEDLFDLHARSRSEGLGAEVQRRIMLGTYVLSAGYYEAYYKRALQARRLIKEDLDRALARCHAIVGPVAPTPAFRFGEREDPVAMYLGDVYTTLANIAGLCAISVPAGFRTVDKRHLPIGLQIQCQAYDETTMLRIARMFEQATAPSSVNPEP